MRGGGGGARARATQGRGAQGTSLSSGRRCDCVQHEAKDDAGACQDRKEQIRHRLHILHGLEVAEAKIEAQSLCLMLDHFIYAENHICVHKRFKMLVHYFRTLTLANLLCTKQHMSSLTARSSASAPNCSV